MEQPESPFEIYQALRLAKQLWGSTLSLQDRRSLLAKNLSIRWLNGSGKDDPPVWGMTRNLLQLAEGMDLADDIQVTLPDGVAVRLGTEHMDTFQELVDFLYPTLGDRVQVFH